MQPNLLDGLRHGLWSAVACGTGFLVHPDECRFLAEYIDDAEKAIATQVRFESELAALEHAINDMKEAHKKSADDVMNIIGDALSGDCDRYLNYDPSGKRYCKWGIVEKDIRALFEIKQEELP